MIPSARIQVKQLRSSRENIPAYLLNGVAKPTLKAFIYAYLYLVLPKIIGRLVKSLRKHKWDTFLPRMKKTLLRALHPRKFPVFAASLVAGINILEPLLYGLLKKKQLLFKTPSSRLFLSTLLSALVSALITFPLYQGHVVKFGRHNSLDLTLLVATRAMDTAFSSNLAKVAPKALSGYGDGLLFIVSCTLIMFCWFFYPEKLPPEYGKWITSAANMDPDFLEVLRLVRDKKLIYGEHGPYEDYLTPYFIKYGQDPKRGNIVLNQPIECEAVHAFKTKSCELHALWRFWRGFKFAMTVYTPLNLLMLLFKLKVKMSARLARALKSSIRSSCFLGAFIGFYWYAVCLARTRLFPKLFPNVPRTRFDDTICPSAGAVMCGFSAFIETVQRRKELALFVAPRGLGTLVPSEPTDRNLKIESFVFSISLAVLVAYSRNQASSVRGIFGKGLQQVFNIGSYT
ncbi:conserved hypothetical protein [Lodderomyces elongisporus NRRL YB-4239]|uniref:Transmembrane protein 135 N-terminal domain-containing protein n=1 Tax=Lodderomyces elongisporus (strain ATCC 11503 / CBS 2605 / JCM 1781 / NBRC 1676 / NRRL YB-4239) TaxID=379508 RepID=A5DTX2_LODEL|nr:conserved hypothetical protein [Lodderomyces elongisporus NRRL YB-4239]